VASTTVLTVMNRLARKGMLVKQPAGRAHADGAVQSRAAYAATLMASVLGSVEDPSAVLLHFSGQLSPDEAERLWAMLNESPTGRERPL
jgi:predicted transcriptional regulator